ncbi:hypothetical protein CBP51_19055 [Cellvibrio mixtus]|uniref:Thymidine phosphorylase n=1 Tax=Cellvibrio mixtus TaxID=39650 RepID=A0A266Q2R1_9GAMM|nr:DUF1631 domain-containing protein [Cellvibrio mixtus]OZY83906.1 hypothetical protein CBP51_19055 [Cellvibrio mixtus]
MNEQTKSDSNKVVQLNPDRSSGANQAIVLTRLPAPIHALRDKARQQLQTYLRELFDRIDDAMFELADKANNNQDQNIFFDSMREVRIRRRAIENAFFRAIDIGFARLLDPTAYKDEKRPTEKTVSLDELTIVKNDELEEMVAVESMVSKANEQFAELIQHLTLRIDHLVPTKVYQKNNPLGVDVICNAFTDATATLSIDLKAKLVMFKIFDNIMMSKLGKLFEALNQTLIDANILPSLKSELRQAKRPIISPSTTTNSADHFGQGLTAELQGNMAGGLQSYDEQTNQVLHQLRNLLGSQRSSSQSMPGEEINSKDLIKILSLAQQQNTAAANSAQPANLRGFLTELLRNETQTAAAINQVDDDVINLVSMMFEFILDDRNLAAPMKVLIGRLQIPMVKVAIADKTFFSKGGHPARRLLNEMAMACLGWQEPTDENQRKDTLYAKMEEVVQTILSEFDTDISLFDRLLLDFRSYLDKEKRRASILEQRTIDAEDGKAKSERARAQVDAELNRITVGRDLPLAVTKLLREAWANVMFITSLKQGVDSDEWRSCSLTAQQLVWSVVAPMDKDNRQKLLKLVPELLQKLRTGLESISFSPFETGNLFKQLETVHLERLRGDAKSVAAGAAQPSSGNDDAGNEGEENKSAANNNTGSDSAIRAQQIAVKAASMKAAMADAQMKPSVVAVATQVPTSVVNDIADNQSPVADSTEPAASANEAVPAVDATVLPQDTVADIAQGIVAEPVTHTIAADAQHLALVNNITQGTWFEMQGEAGEKYRCRLAAIIRSVGKYIFVNRSGMKVAEESRESLAIALQTKRLTILDDGMLFDRALESVISSLRDQRSLS